MMLWVQLENGDEQIIPISRIKYMMKVKDKRTWVVYLTDGAIFPNVKKYSFEYGSD